MKIAVIGTNEEFIEDSDKKRADLYGYDKTLLEKKRTYNDLEDIEEHLDSSQFNIDLNGYHYECLFQRGRGKNLYVIYDGARKSNFPGFPRWGYYNLFSGSMLCIEDPMYYMYPDIHLGWYYGTKTESLIELSLEIVKSVCHHEGIDIENIIFFSSSGGGYAGIYASCLMNHTMAVALNPQLYIYDYNKRQYDYFLSLGIDLRANDPLNRNNLCPLIKKSKSRFLIIYNSQSKDDWENQMRPFCEEMNISPEYGLVPKDNVLLWIYEAVGIPKPHTSFETKGIFLYIDYIAKSFFHHRLSVIDMQNVFTINECWREIYLLKAEQKNLKERIRGMQKRQVMFVNELPIQFNGSRIVDHGKDILVEAGDGSYRYFKYKKLLAHAVFSIEFECEGNFSEYTVGVYDSKLKQFFVERTYPVKKEVVCNFITNEDTDGIWFLIYAGIAGKTQGNSLHLKELTVRSCPLE